MIYIYLSIYIYLEIDMHMIWSVCTIEGIMYTYLYLLAILVYYVFFLTGKIGESVDVLPDRFPVQILLRLPGISWTSIRSVHDSVNRGITSWCLLFESFKHPQCPRNLQQDPPERTPKPGYLIALGTFLGVRW